MRSGTFAFCFLSLCFALAGCGDSASSPAPGELESYLQANPEAAARGGQAEPEGINGPAALPGEGNE